MRCMKDFALESSAPFANGFRTVYGWHEGDINHRSAWSSANSLAEINEMSAYALELKGQSNTSRTY